MISWRSCPVGQPSGNRVIIARNSSLKQQFTDAEGIVSVSLPTTELQPALTFELVTIGRGQALVIADVVPGSAAEQAGIRRGQRLTAISDALRPNEVWPIGDRPSMRFVRDTFRMRRSGDINLQLQECLTEQQIASMLPPSRFGPAGSSDSEDSSGSAVFAAAAPGAAAAAASSASDSSSEDSRDSWGMLGDQSDNGGSDSKAETIGERFARREAEAERSSRLPDPMQQRIQKRKDYMDQLVHFMLVTVINAWAAGLPARKLDGAVVASDLLAHLEGGRLTNAAGSEVFGGYVLQPEEVLTWSPPLSCRHLCTWLVETVAARRECPGYFQAWGSWLGIGWLGCIVDAVSDSRSTADVVGCSDAVICGVDKSSKPSSPAIGGRGKGVSSSGGRWYGNVRGVRSAGGTPGNVVRFSGVPDADDVGGSPRLAGGSPQHSGQSQGRDSDTATHVHAALEGQAQQQQAAVVSASPANLIRDVRRFVSPPAAAALLAKNRSYSPLRDAWPMHDARDSF